MNEQNDQPSTEDRETHPTDAPAKKPCQKVSELTDTLQRLQADFDNYKKHVEKEKAKFQEFQTAVFIEKLLPVIDSFDLALQNTQDHERFVKGVELVYSQLFSTLKKEGLGEIERKDTLDPNLHEVVMKENSDKGEDAILEVFQKGYMFKDKVLRHAKVKVSS